MPRNSSGQYTLPVGNPVVTNTTITSTWANATMPDLGAEIQNSLDRSGRGSMLAQFKAFDGTLANPGIGFGNDLTMGFARLNTNEIQGIIAGAKVFAMTGAGFAVTGALSSTGALTVAGANLGGAVTGVTDLTTTGNTILGDAVGDTLNVANGTLYVNAVGSVGIGTTTPDTCRFTIKQPATTGIAGVNMFNDAGVSNFIFTAGSAHAIANWRNNLVIFTGSTQDIIFYTNNIDRGRFDSTGRMGVAMVPLGDTSGYGGKTLEVSGPVYARQSSDNTKYLAIGAAGGNAFIAADGAGQGLIFQITSAEAMRIDNSRRIGIGRVPTTARLEVETAGQDITFFNSTNASGGWVTWQYNGASIGYVGSGGPLLTGAANTDLAIRGVNSVRIGVGGTEFLGIKSDGRVYGHALHNTGTVTGTTDQFIASGTYTPTVTVVANCNTPVAVKCQWMRVGNVVTVSGQATVTTAGAGSTTFAVSLPIASNLANSNDLAGAFNSALASPVGSITGDAVNDRASFVCTAAGVGTVSVFFTFTYEIL